MIVHNPQRVQTRLAKAESQKSVNVLMAIEVPNSDFSGQIE